MDEKYRTRYVSSLGACLFYLSHNSPITKMFFDVWAKSILRCDTDVNNFWRNDLKSIKEAIKIQRKRIKLFSFRYDFFFDSLYLLQSSLPNGYNTSLTTDIQKHLSDNVCGMFSKVALKYVCEYFNGKNGNDGKRISSNLREHKLINETFLVKTEKKILVVATVSAGKSTLINALVGYKLNKVKSIACTNQLCHIVNKQMPDGVTMKERNAGNYSYSECFDKISSDNYSEIAFPFDSQALNSKKVCFIDTPGYNNASADGDLHKQITGNAIKENDYDIMLYIANANYMGRQDEQEFLKFIIKHTQKPILFVMNKLDSFHPSDDSIEESVRRYNADLTKLGISHSRIFPISAEAALLMKQEKRGTLSEDEQWYLDSYKKKFSKSFYDLPKYANFSCDWHEDSLLDRTGITLLENDIIRYL